MFEMDETQRNTVTKNVQDMKPVSKCPSIWVEAIPDEPLPTYQVYISISAPQEDGFMISIFPVAPEMGSSGNVSLGVTLPGSGGKFYQVLQYPTGNLPRTLILIF